MQTTNFLQGVFTEKDSVLPSVTWELFFLAQCWG